MRKRSKQFVIRLSESEWNHLNEMVKESNLSRESYLRMCINGLLPRPVPTKELIELIEILREIAENMNQIAISVIHKIQWINPFIWKTMKSYKIKSMRL